MNFKKISRSFFVLCLILISVFSFIMLNGAAVKAAEPIVLAMAPSSSPPPPARGMTLVYTDQMKLLEERTNGRIKVDIYWGQSLAKATELVMAINTGICDIAKLSPHREAGKIPLSAVSHQPGIDAHIFSQGMALWDLLKQEPLLSEYSKFGMRPIALTFVMDTSLLSKEPIKSIADLKGMKISARGTVGETVELLGGVPVAMSPPEQYDALKKGIIGGIVAPCSAINDFKFYEGGKYFTTFLFGSRISAIVIREKVWQKLPADIQKIITDSGPDLIKIAYEVMKGEDAFALNIMKENGVKVFEPSVADGTALKKVQSGQADKWAASQEKKGLPAKNLLADFRALAKKYDASNPYIK